MSDLTDKQARFVEEYLVDLNATQAAIRAGYSQDTARQMGAENLSKPVIADAIARAQQARTKRTQVDQDYVVHGIRETIERCKQAEPVLKANGEPVMVDTPDGEQAPAYKFESSSVLKGYELLGRHLGMFMDKSTVTVTHLVEELSDDELDAEIDRLSESVRPTAH